MIRRPGLRAAACLALACLLPADATLAGSRDGTLDLYWIDSEGGSSTLVVTPAG